MIPDLTALPWIQNASGAIQFIIILLFALDKLFAFLKDMRSSQQAADEKRNQQTTAGNRLDVDRFSELSDAQKEFLAVLREENAGLRDQLKSLEKENRSLHEEVRQLRGEVEGFRRVQAESRDILRRVDANTKDS